ncbi:MAG: FAD-dependent oxidoreductase [Peptococcaceae bacterium]|jgi:2,4-dienoyl-CoA reductase-like NADH-dependent reductase (Old Yellow Enzyme family)/NADPH-dependent 2,4-dienoyl-CoA reductase/sulfur reductase-like enzyme|nr:FAD-dependent oxidoreductase [Peptococcaceae bacterium]
MSKYKTLFSPIILGQTQFRNRIFAAPIGQEYYPSSNLHPGDDFIAFYERKAQGGAATVCIGSAMADNSRGAVGPTIRLDDPTNFAPHFRLTQCITRHGAVADIELQHCGANAYHSKLVLGNEIYGAFATTNGLGMHIPEMPEEVILDTIEKFGDAAQTAKHCGYGLVTVHAGHGWLFNQFLGPQNNRKDRWGGNMENRARIVIEIAKNIKKKCGQGFPICIRISGSEIFEGGYDIDYGVEIAKQLDGHYDLINVSVGAHEEPTVFTNTHPSMFLEDGVNVKYAAEVKRVVKYSKIAAVGALAEPDLMEEIIASGQADVVMLCRQLMADPDTPFKAQTGREKEIRKCIRCFECFSGHFTKQSSYCAINPEIGFEREVKYADPIVRNRKKILVVGGGVAGMQAALTSASRGHEVILCEKTGNLGGALRCELKVPFKQNLQKYLDQQAEAVKSSNIELHLNTEVTPDLAQSIKPDVIIAALGARPLIPNIPGLDSKKVLSAEYAYLHAEETGDKVIVLGGGLSGIELAIYLSGLGKKVGIMEMANSLNYSGNVIHSMAINNEIKRLGIEIILSTKAAAINAEGVVGEFVGDSFSPAPVCDTIAKGMLVSVISEAKLETNAEIGSRRLYEADTVIYALGQIPRREETNSLRNYAPLFFAIGDCVEPKNIYAANSTAFTVARDIGRY